MNRFLLLAALAGLSACTFEGGGIAPFRPAAPAPTELDLDVPYVPTPRPVVAAMLDLARVGPNDYLIDLGSGDGRIAIAAAQRGARALGVDIDPNRVAEAVIAAQMAQVETRARFRRQDLFDTPLREASVIAMYLLPAINMRLRPRLLTELRPGTRIVAHAFNLGDWRPDAHREVDAANIYLWVVPAVVGGSWLLEEGGQTMRIELDQRFQEVGGTLTAAGRSHALRDAVLEGAAFRFTVDLPGGARTYRGIVDGGTFMPDPAVQSAGWRARRAQ